MVGVRRHHVRAGRQRLHPAVAGNRDGAVSDAFDLAVWLGSEAFG